jgi:sporulation protein YlmC with PRC-barrel domain
MKLLHFLVACALGATASADNIRVIAANELFDKHVVTSSGEDVGPIQYVVIRTDDAQIQNIVFGTKKGLVAVPFECVEGRIHGDELRLDTSMEKIQQAPRVAADQLHTLMNQKTVVAIQRYWMPMQKESAVVETVVAPYLVLSKSSHQIMQPDMASQPIDSLDVTSSDGKTLGEVERVVIDLDNGSVAYTLIGRGGFLGLGKNFVAVPLQAIEFSDVAHPTLKIPVRQFNSMRGYLDDDVPRSVSKKDLDRVYKQFEMKPYLTPESGRASL